MTAGLSYYAKDFDDVASGADFAEAVVRLAVVDADVVTGRTMGHLDVLDGNFGPYRMS